jgi:hypothetical protein
MLQDFMFQKWKSEWNRDLRQPVLGSTFLFTLNQTMISLQELLLTLASKKEQYFNDNINMAITRTFRITVTIVYLLNYYLWDKMHHYRNSINNGSIMLAIELSQLKHTDVFFYAVSSQPLLFRYLSDDSFSYFSRLH